MLSTFMMVWCAVFASWHGYRAIQLYRNQCPTQAKVQTIYTAIQIFGFIAFLYLKQLGA